MAVLQVSIQQEDFDVAALQRQLLQGGSLEGAVATFTGYVRVSNESREVHTMELEHYPGMTQKSIHAILEEASQRWPLQAATAVHRVGILSSGEQIVWVGCSSSHREAAFSACEFIMDYLKTHAPFWKKESGAQGEHWVDARASDDTRAERWQDNDK